MLPRELGLRDLILFNIAAVVGIRWLAAAAHTGPGAITVWGLAAVLFFVPSALAVASLSARMPEEGGIYVWTRRAFGPWHGFLCAWCYWLSNLFYFPSLLMAGVGMAAEALGLEQAKAAVIAVSVAILWLALLANLFGLVFGKWVANAGSLATYLAGLLIILAGAAAWLRQGPATPMNLVPAWDWAKLNFWSQIAFAFGGLELGAVLAGEVRDPARTVPRAAWISGLAIAAFYIGGTLAMLALLRPEQISILTGLVQAGEAAGGGSGALLIACVLAAVAGQLAAWIGGSARIPFTLALDALLPRAFTRVHARWRTPHIAIIVQGAVATVFLAALQAGETLRAAYQLLVDLTVIVYFIPFLYMFAAAWRVGLRLSALSGGAVSLAGIAVSLVPTTDAAAAWLFELKLLGGCALLIATARIVYVSSNRSR